MEEGVQDVFLEDALVEQVVAKVSETSQSSKSQSFSPTGLPQSSSLPGYNH